MRPLTPYGTTKQMVEEVLEIYREPHKLNYVILRYFNAGGATHDHGEAHPRETHLIPNVLDAAAAYGDKAQAAIAALLETGFADMLPKRIPNPSWFDAARLPQILLRDKGSALPEASMRYAAVVTGIAADIDDDPRLAVLAETCEHDSLREFTWAVFEQWLAAGAPPADRWALSALRFFGDDSTVAGLTPMIKAWPGQNQHHRAVTGPRVLGGIGSEEALRAMQHISQRAKFKAIKAEAAQQIQVIANGLGLTGEQLADRLLPDFGLGGDGVLVLDYGPRKFTIAFDEQLRPYVTDDDGKPRKSLPKPGAKDDPELAEEAYRRFKLLKKELRSVAADQVARFEAAMLAERDWSAEEFRRFFAEHPLIRHLARRLVWLAEAEGARYGFRIAEDGSYSDLDDDAVALPESARVRVAQWLFGGRVLAFLGTISYSLYLWHLVVFQYAARGGLTGWKIAAGLGGLALILVPIVLIVAWVSYRWTERPFLVTAPAAKQEHASEAR